MLQFNNVAWLNLCRRDAYTVIAPNEEKRRMMQESKINLTYKMNTGHAHYCVSKLQLCL